ncbi:unnamed protein product, partial [Mesorhabditis belari]|uniref:IQ domain-containing protein E n=1 Tax=Mesorhabditis belari TaxID=2138241 RepID=A0AAF3J529_9BILA
MVSMLEDRLATIRQIYAPRAKSGKGGRTRNESGHPQTSKTPTLPPAFPTNTRMIAYRVPSAQSVFSLARSKAGRSPRMEQLNDAREQLLQSKRNCAKLVQENTILKTRLLKLSAQSGKREHHLQRLLNRESFEPAESYDTNEAITLATFQKRLIKSEALIKQQQDVIEKLKNDRVRARSAASERRHSETRGIRGGEPTQERSQSLDDLLAKNERLAEKYRSLKRENKYLRERIARLETRHNGDDHELSDWSKEDLINLVNRLETRALKAPIRAAVATLEEKTEVGKLIKELTSVHRNLENSQQENEVLKSEVETLVKELEHARIVHKDARPPGVPPLDMKSIDNVSDSQEDDQTGNAYETYQDGEQNEGQRTFDLDVVAMEVFEHTKAHLSRIKFLREQMKKQ